MNVLVVNNQKGGVGKTTIAVHVAWHFAERGRRVLFLDLDAQSNASATLASMAGATSAARLFEAGQVPSPRPCAPDEMAMTLVPAEPALLDVERADSKSVGVFRENLAAAASGFDLCVIDTPPSMGLRNLAALVAATHVLSPIYLEDYSLQGVKSLLQTVIGVQQRYHRPDLQFLGLLPSKFNSKSPRQRAHLEQLLREAGKYVFPGHITDRDGYAEAVAEKVPVWRLKKRSAQEAGREIRGVLDRVQNVLSG
ncbi:ParA family protein [Methylorubrum sp. SB2]|uniref:ParA family protein n=1 Tax=Methylorubrum subtropicum TaxID=3138812 RepID=UPI00313B4C1B